MAKFYCENVYSAVVGQLLRYITAVQRVHAGSVTSPEAVLGSTSYGHRLTAG